MEVLAAYLFTVWKAHSIVFATLGLSFALLGIIIIVIWTVKSFSKRSVRVSCWFCGTKSRVPHGNQNCWDCPSCEQYNGFLSSGDYNKPIPAQYRSEFNHSVRSVKNPDAFHSKSESVLCLDCVHNQTLKVQQLAHFEPLDERTYEKELEEFKARLENTYALCRTCQRKAVECVRQCDVSVLPNYLLWRKDTAERSLARNFMSTNSIGHRLKRGCLRLVALANLATALSLFTVHSLQEVSSAKNYLSFLPQDFVKVLLVALLIVCTVHFLVRLFFSHCDLRLFMEVVIICALIANKFLTSSGPAAMFVVTELFAFLLSLLSLPDTLVTSHSSPVKSRSISPSRSSVGDLSGSGSKGGSHVNNNPFLLHNGNSVASSKSHSVIRPARFVADTKTFSTVSSSYTSRPPPPYTVPASSISSAYPSRPSSPTLRSDVTSTYPDRYSPPHSVFSTYTSASRHRPRSQISYATAWPGPQGDDERSLNGHSPSPPRSLVSHQSERVLFEAPAQSWSWTLLKWVWGAVLGFSIGCFICYALIPGASWVWLYMHNVKMN